MNSLNRVSLICVLLSLTAVGCGQASTQSASALETNPEFQPYISRFEQLSETAGNPVKVTNLKIQFGKLSNPRERGVCEFSDDTTPTITISEDIWNQIDDSEREELVFHELGHCVLRRKHLAGNSEKGIPNSIMNPYSIRGSIYEQNRDAYLGELFGKRNDF